jgi:hypothetical protein
MIPRPGLIATLLLAMAGADAHATEPTVDTILRRAPAEEPPVSSSRLGPPRLQGDFAAGLDDLLAATADDSATTSAPLQAAATFTKPAESQPDPVLPVIGGLVGGAAGLCGGALAGALLASSQGSDAGPGGAFMGAFLGEMLLLPLGVHLGNRSKGSYLANLGMSVATAAAGGGFIATNGKPGVVVSVVSLHLGLVVGTERAIAARRIAGRTP